MAAAQPRRRRRDREPGRLADDRRRAGLAGHARSRASRREDATGARLVEHLEGSEPASDPEDEALRVDAVGSALLVVLDRLRPAERLAFVLHDIFAVPFDEIGPIIGRSPTAAKQLASRARHKVRGTEPEPGADPARQREVVDAFLAASRGGDFEALLGLLDPDVVLEADGAAVSMGSPGEIRGAVAVAGTFSGRALAAQPAIVDGVVGIVWAVKGRPKVVWDLAVSDGKIVHIEMLAAGDTLDGLDVALLDG
jgi:RNA polymerase sigma-70 factor (ECF subfamily)